MSDDDSRWGFEAKSFEDIITAASLVSEKDTVSMNIPPNQFREVVSELLSLKKEIEKCHVLCKKAGLPDMGSGIHGLSLRLEFLKEV